MLIQHHSVREYERWFRRLDSRTKARVAAEVALLAECWPLGMPRVRRLEAGLYELWLLSLGLRIYFTVTDDMITLLTYGRKDTQQRDLDHARRRLT